MNPTKPANDQERLRVLRRYAILDTAPEAAFDRLTNLAARLLKVPVALMTLVDANRQWFKACYGIDLTETSREVSFCAHAILSDEMMIIPDATKDPRFADNPLVTGPPGIRFYAGVPLQGVDGANIGTLCIIDLKPRELSATETSLLRDLAEIAMDELRLRLAMLEKNQLAAAVTNVDCGILMTDPTQPDNPIVYCNPAFTEMTGYGLPEIVGRNCRFLSGDATDSEERNAIRTALAERRLYQGLIQNYRRNGEVFWNDLTISPVFDQEGRLISFVGLQNDVTERKRSEDSLRESYARLQELEGLRDNLTHMIVHDLRSPLTVLKGFLGVLNLRLEGKLDQGEREALAYAMNASEQLNTMVTSLLDVSRLEAGEMPVALTECDLAALTREALKEQVALASAKRLQFEVAPGRVPVLCDPALTARVMTNLIGNALKFTPEPGGISLRLELEEEFVRLLVIDQGPGIHPDHHTSIFEKFGQVKETRSKDSTGLGLTFCRLAIEAQGGRIGLQSKLGSGSTFWFTLPRPTRIPSS